MCLISLTLVSCGLAQSASKDARIDTKAITVAGKGLIEIHYHHEWRNIMPVLPALPDRFGSFMRAGWTPVDFEDKPIRKFSQKLRLQYLSTSIARSGVMFQKDYPLKVDMLNADEHSFLHGADPALTSVISKGLESVVYFQQDQRHAVGDHVLYNVYRINGGPVSVSKSREWRQMPWEKIATADSLAANNQPFMEYHDRHPPLKGRNTACYLVKTVTAGHETSFGLPACEVSNSITNGVVFASAITQIDPQKSSRVPNQSQFNVHYQIRASGIEITPGKLGAPKVVVYQFTRNCKNKRLGDSCIDGFRRNAEYPMAITWLNDSGRFVATADFFHLQPWMTSILGADPSPAYSKDLTLKEYTEQIVYRIESNGISFPVEGFLTAHVNNRLRDRIWGGYELNPLGDAHRSSIREIVKNMLRLGYNGVYFDEWRPEKTVFDKGHSFGWQMEAPAIEYPYPEAYKSNPKLDPWIHALDDLANWLHREFPGLLLVGNLIKASDGYHNALVQRALGALDGGLFEGCLASDLDANGLPTVTEGKWRDHLRALERALEDNKITICLVRARLPDVLSPRLRLYNLASFLMAYQPDKPIYFANTEINPKLLTGAPHYPVTYFPEYDLQLGKPLEVMQVMGSHFFGRKFERGLVLVNASRSRQQEIEVPRDFYPVGIIDFIQKTDVVSPGKLCVGWEKCSALRKTGSTIVVPPTTGVILTRRS
jgi:hypothetical protein